MSKTHNDMYIVSRYYAKLEKYDGFRKNYLFYIFNKLQIILIRK